MNQLHHLMRCSLLSKALIIGFLSLSIFSCKKTTEEFQTEPLTDYFILEVGKYITYRVDSTVFTTFGTVEETHKYQVKHQVDAQVVDNLGRPSFRIFRFIRDSTGTLPWSPDGTYFITPLFDQVEVIEDNRRVIKMHLPVRNGNSWKGNKYLPTNAYNELNTDNSYDNGMEDWDFYFDGEREATTVINGQTYTDVYTIQQADESYNVPITNPTLFALKVFSQEKYSKGIGLVYRNLILWEYQPNPGGPGPYRVGFGIKMWMIDHN